MQGIFEILIFKRVMDGNVKLTYVKKQCNYLKKRIKHFFEKSLHQILRSFLAHLLRLFLTFSVNVHLSYSTKRDMRSCIFSDFSGKHANSGESVSGPKGIVAKSFGAGPPFFMIFPSISWNNQWKLVFFVRKNNSVNSFPVCIEKTALKTLQLSKIKKFKNIAFMS